MNDFEDDPDAPDDNFVPPSIIATDESDLAAVVDGTPTAWIDPVGDLLDGASRRTVAFADLADVDWSMLFIREANEAQRRTAGRVASMAAERGRAIILECTSAQRRKRDMRRRTLVAHIDPAAWAEVVALAAALLVDVSFGPRLRRRPKRDATLKLRWLRVDPRPAPMIAALQASATGMGQARIYRAARVPTAAERWHAHGDIEPYSAADCLIFEGSTACADVLVIEEAHGAIPVDALRAPEIIPNDPRPFSGDLALLGDDVTLIARRIASLHLLHGEESATRRLFRACARAALVPGIDDELCVRALALGVNELLGREVILGADTGTT